MARKGQAVYTRAAGKRKESEGRRHRKEKRRKRDESEWKWKENYKNVFCRFTVCV